jgi:ElaB/YqjD/DUF883 family membrane-anchored ribosome-binding protein
VVLNFCICKAFYWLYFQLNCIWCRYLENIVSQPNSEHTTSELTKLLDNIEYLVKNYKCPSEKDMKHINRKLKSCLGHSSSHDESKKREKRSKHKSHRSSNDTPNGAPPPIGWVSRTAISNSSFALWFSFNLIEWEIRLL